MTDRVWTELRCRHCGPLIILSLHSEPLQALDWLSCPLAHSLDYLLSIAVLQVFLDNLLQLQCNYRRCSGRTSLSVSSWEASWLTPFWSTPSKCRCKNDEKILYWGIFHIKCLNTSEKQIRDNKQAPRSTKVSIKGSEIMNEYHELNWQVCAKIHQFQLCNMQFEKKIRPNLNFY